MRTDRTTRNIRQIEHVTSKIGEHGVGEGSAGGGGSTPVPPSSYVPTYYIYGF